MEKLRAIARTNEVNGTALRILKLYAEDAATQKDTYLKSLISTLTAQSAQMSEAIKMGKAQSDLDEADIARDAALKNFFAAVNGFAVMKSAALSAPAQKLQGILNRYGAQMTRANYTSESSLIEALLTDLGAAEPSEYIGALPGMAEMVEEIRTTEANFRTRQVAYEKEAAQHKNIVSPTKLKPQMLALINDDLVLHLRAKKKSDPAAFGTLADAVAQAIADTNTAIKQRGGKKEVKA